ncbi:hypothetical protein [Paenibacillus eucommiae]|uniref:Uncharacterized protein n=1 Tax=Paenibacillus eucommiae TaxID=1355755 RepID=A0ABS4J423_9BACL|nr:hypothetical protein [Paenibacillus eucommiae]MBP1993976.1 hypothetical protein [Paenibacillus eucommiae]
MRSYQHHLQQLSGHAITATFRKPTFRSSAIFPVIHLPGITTRICYLGYWMIKRSIGQIHSVVTLRTSDGDILYRSNKLIEEPRAYRIEFSELLKKLDLEEHIEFLGSLEVEFFSAHDLVFPYPAVVVNYYGPGFSSVVHTSQRIFNDIEDRSSNLEVMVPEAGFTIYVTDDREPFFTFINGFEQVNEGTVKMLFYNHRQEVLEQELLIPELLPYQTTMIYPSHSLDLLGFLDGMPGTAKITFDVKWVFPRIIAGNYQKSLNAVSVTHTYYDCSGADSDSDYWDEAQTDSGYHGASLMIPLSILDERFTNVHLYPIYSPSEFELDVEIYSSNGTLLAAELQTRHLLSPGGRMEIIELKSICSRLGIVQEQAKGAKLIARPVQGSRLPARIKIGLDYGINAAALPCNICKNMEVWNPRLEQKKRSFHWAPVLADQADSVVWLVNSAPIIQYDKEAEVQLTFYREADTNTLIRHMYIAPNGTEYIRLSEDEELQIFFRGHIGWYTAISANPYLATYYLSESSSGVVGGDHDF